jgi:hypothetical protein
MDTGSQPYPTIAVIGGVTLGAKHHGISLFKPGYNMNRFTDGTTFFFE